MKKTYSLRAVKAILTKYVGIAEFSTLNGYCIWRFEKNIDSEYLQKIATKIPNTKIQDLHNLYRCGVTFYIPFSSLNF